MSRILDNALYLVALAWVKFLQALPVRGVARLGRALGAVAFVLDRRHRRVALRNLELALGAEKSAAELHALARENFRRLGENYCCAIKTAPMSQEELVGVAEFCGVERIVPPGASRPVRNVVLAIGHFGNFELYAHYHSHFGIECATTYRGLRPPALDRLLLKLRQQSGCLYFERRTDSAALKTWMARGIRALGLLADQHAGSGGVRVPFFGHDCATTASPAVFALRYDCSLNIAICYRVALGRWRLEVEDEIPTHEAGKPRSIVAITRDINRAFEAAIRRDPANWFWVHNRWKPVKDTTSSAGPTLPEAAPASPDPHHVAEAM